jgi:hypothetical protein
MAEAYRDCTTCGGTGKVTVWGEIGAEIAGIDGPQGRNFRRCPECRGEGRTRELVATAMRGTKPHKTVWLCETSIPHRSGWTEKYISGVYASRDGAVEGNCLWLTPHHGEPTVSVDDDSAYIRYPSGNSARIWRMPVQTTRPPADRGS